MSNFKYRAITEEGEVKIGEYFAKDKKEFLDLIKEKGYYLLKVKEIKEKNKINFFFIKKVKIKDIAIFSRQFYTMLDAGSTILNCIEILKSQTENKRIKEALIYVEDSVKKGDTLSEAMKKENRIFPQLLINMIEVGEKSGELDIILKRMSQYYEKENKINNKVKGAMIYPIILAIVSVGVIGFIVSFIFPTFIEVFTTNNVELPSITKGLLSISAVISNHYIKILIGFVITIIVMKRFLKSHRGTFISNKFKLRIPIVRKINEKIIVSRFTRTLSTVLSSGISLIEALNITAKVVGNKIIEDNIYKVREKVIKGGGLSNPLKESGFFPPMLCSMISIGEESGSLDSILDKTADFYDEELEVAIYQFTTLLEPLMIVIMGLIVGIMIVSIMLPMFNMYNSIQ